MSNLYDIEVTTIGGESIKVGNFSGKVLLIVNVASACGLTPQYEALEKFYAANKAQGLEILAFPCNQFGAQEPGTEAEISEFCSSNFGVTFPLFSKVDVNGETQHPLYKALLTAIPQRTAAADSKFEERLRSFGKEINDDSIMWNFEKFLVSRTGQVVGHFSPDMTVEDPILAEAVSKELAG